MFGVNMTFISSHEVKKCIFHECRIWIFFLLYSSLSIEEMQILQILQNLSSFPLTINVNKKKSSSRSYIFHCSEEWKYKLYIFTSENITFSKYAFYFINNSLYFITLYIINISTFHIWRRQLAYMTSFKMECDQRSKGFFKNTEAIFWMSRWAVHIKDYLINPLVISV